MKLSVHSLWYLLLLDVGVLSLGAYTKVHLVVLSSDRHAHTWSLRNLQAKLAWNIHVIFSAVLFFFLVLNAKFRLWKLLTL